jgi:hypothetical protein
MSSNLQLLRSLLLDISELGGVAEDQDVNHIDSFDPLLERAHSLGVQLHAPTTLGALRSAVESACASEDDDSDGKAPHDQTAHILGNVDGVPGDGP